MFAVKDIKEMPKYCWYYDIEESKKWKECPIYKSCKHHSSNIDVKPSDCPLVEIVTCKDCVYCKEGISEGFTFLWCEKDSCAVSKNYYCGGGRRG